MWEDDAKGDGVVQRADSSQVEGSSRGGGKAAVSSLACRSIGARLARSSAKSAVNGGTCRAAAVLLLALVMVL